MRRVLCGWACLVAPVVVLVILVQRVGTAPFLQGVRTIDGRALAAALSISVVTTVSCAWRWRIVARGLGVDLPLSAAVAACYRSVFLNVALPGGVVGDLHRGVSHGREVQDVSRAVRAVAWERGAGQVVQVVLTAAVLLVLPSPVRSSMLPAVIAIAIAARTAGTTAPVSRMLPIALLVMIAMVLPSIGGWGPREGVTAWAFGAAGLGAHRGVSAAVVYGVMVLVASLPGAAVLLAPWLRGTRLPRWRRGRPREEAAHI